MTIEYDKITTGHNSESGMKHDVYVRLPGPDQNMELKTTIDKGGNEDISVALSAFPQTTKLRVDVAQDGDKTGVRSVDLTDSNSEGQFLSISADGRAGGYEIDGTGRDFERMKVVQGKDQWDDDDDKFVLVGGNFATKFGDLSVGAIDDGIFFTKEYDGQIGMHKPSKDPPVYLADQNNPCDNEWTLEEGTYVKEDCLGFNGYYWAIESKFFHTCVHVHNDGHCA